MQIPTDFFTLATLFTFTGAALAAWLVPYAFFVLIGEKFRPYMKWVSFVVAVALMELAAVLNAEPGWVKYVIAAFNGLVIFLAAVGTNTIAADRTMTVTEVERGDVADEDVSVSDGRTTLQANEGMFKYWY